MNKFIGYSPTDKVLIFFYNLFRKRVFRLFYKIIRRLIIFRGVYLTNTEFIVKLNLSNFGDKLLLTKGSYEPKTLALIKKILREGGFFFDVGANMGLHSLTGAANKKVNVFSFEAHYKAFSSLSTNKTINGFNNLTLFNIPVSDAKRILVLNNHSSGNVSSSFLSKTNINVGEGHTVSTMALKDILEFSNLNNIKLIKIDVEGHEQEVINGIDWDNKSLKIENIILEYRPKVNNELDSIVQHLMSLGYKLKNMNMEELDYENISNLPENNLWFCKD
ncbi:FkbM family methyltransferase [Flexithrix dorotheae]|uniref:FkbM family methyltransferase n=1 Tax=Flexithrix dorotheae TaxID=70993 RepID=UPI00038063E3|nr:FkbM family methyltransferase [Flexithrix dorotheae]